MKVDFLFGNNSKNPTCFVEETKRAPLNKTRLVLLMSSIMALSAGHKVNASPAEHAAVQALVPVNAFNRQVIQNGAWSNPATWSGGKIPVAGQNIHVPQDKTLLVDISSDASLGTVRVDGTLNFATNKNIKIKLDTMVVTEKGAINIGSERSRVPSANKIEIVIAKNGPINRVWDPKNVSRGVILQGKTRIYGADKSPFHALSVDPAAGSTQITLDNIPTGWTKGDIIAITATRFRHKQTTDIQHITQDELRKIKSISGNVITLGQVADANVLDPLQYSHIPNIPNMPVYAANLSRNVIIAGEGGESVPAAQRGHFMVMHQPDVVIKGAGFYYLGRTDKSKNIDDFKLDGSGSRIKDANGNFIPGANNNPRGRYAVHFHHTGVYDVNIPPAICSGNVVFSSPGWGFVNHTSNVLMENNASYNVYGSHFVAEDGNEMGAFKHNIAIKSQGRATIVKHGQNNHDVGHTGHGFWLESRNLAVENNVVSGVNKAGIVYWHRNFIPGTDLWIPKANLLTENKDLIKNASKIYYENIPITHEKNTTVLASGAGMDIIKAFAKQNHGVRSIIDSFKAYSVLSGINIDYSEKYTFKDAELVADPLTRKWNHGLLIHTQTTDVVVHHSSMDGFIHPVITGVTANLTPTEANFVNVKVDGRAINPETDLHASINDIMYSYDPAYQHVITTSGNDMSGLGLPEQAGLSFSHDSDLSPNFPLAFNQAYYVKGTTTDSLGEVPFTSKWLDKQLIGAVKTGYYTDNAGNKYVFLKDLISDRITGATKSIYTKLKLVSRFYELGPKLGDLPE